MKLRITQNTTIGGRCVSKGEDVDADQKQAQILVGYGKAELWDAEKHGEKARKA